MDIQTDPIWHLTIKKDSEERIYWIYQFSIQNIVLVLKFQHLPALIRSHLQVGMERTCQQVTQRLWATIGKRQHHEVTS